MLRAPFRIVEPTSSQGKKFIAWFLDECGNVFKTVTLKGCRNKTAAVRYAEILLKDGIIPNSANPEALEYLLSFWRHDSEYVIGKALRGKNLSFRYLEENRLVILKHLKAYLERKKLMDPTPVWLERVILNLAKANVGHRTINRMRQALLVPYGNFCRLHRIANQLSIIEKIQEQPKERGTLNAHEIAKIVILQGEEPRAMAAILLAALCGLRLGECRDLNWLDVNQENGILEIRNNFVSTHEGLKAPKCGSTRGVRLQSQYCKRYCSVGRFPLMRDLTSFGMNVHQSCLAKPLQFSMVFTGL
jgi:hypothetical protein